MNRVASALPSMPLALSSAVATTCAPLPGAADHDALAGELDSRAIGLGDR